MDVELLIVADCPHEQDASRLLRAALDDIGLGALGISVVEIESQAQAEHRQFVGSPSFCIDGHDVFPEPGLLPAVSCRIYTGNEPLPSLRDLRQALKRAAAVSVAQ